MVTPICDKCRRRNIVSFLIEPVEAWRTVVLNRWKSICPSCFDAEAERAGVCYQFMGVQATSWCEKPEPTKRYGRRRRQTSIAPSPAPIRSVGDIVAGGLESWHVARRSHLIQAHGRVWRNRPAPKNTFHRALFRHARAVVSVSSNPSVIMLVGAPFLIFSCRVYLAPTI
jgi:hypothetical protein